MSGDIESKVGPALKSAVSNSEFPAGFARDVVMTARARRSRHRVVLVVTMLSALVLGSALAVAAARNQREKPLADSDQAAANQKIEFAAAQSWPVQRVASCKDVPALSGNAVISVERMEGADCILKGAPGHVTVIETTFDQLLMDEQWNEVSEPWKTFGAIPVRRVVRGVLPQLSIRHAPALVSQDTNQVLIVVGDTHAAVEAVINSAQLR